MAEKSKKICTCPKCGADIITGKFGPFCTGKCGINIGKFRGRELTGDQVADLVAKKELLIEDLTTKSGDKKYSIYITWNGRIEPYNYDYNGYKGTKYRLMCDTRFPTYNVNRNEIDDAVDQLTEDEKISTTKNGNSDESLIV